MRSELKEHGIGVSPRRVVWHELEDGQRVLRSAMEAAGERRFFVHPRCQVFIRSAQSYQARELPDGSYDERPDPAPSNHRWSHPLDGARGLVWRWRRELGLS